MPKIEASDLVTRGFFNNAIDGIQKIVTIFRDLKKLPSNETRQRFQCYQRGLSEEIETYSFMEKLRDRIFKKRKFTNEQNYTIGKCIKSDIGSIVKKICPKNY